ncbi:hypothetical protein F4808DRAFT_435480 [Astrocystis sublimbata]|nr:hypothetical protein F4808DRAFT_435480 [Astrocystis sublimbata]
MLEMMGNPAPSPHSFRLSSLEAFMPQAYVRQIYCFPSSSPSAIGRLSQGLGGLARDVPYILSRVVRNTSQTISAVALSAECRSIDDIFSWHDLSDAIDYAALRKGNFSPGAFLAQGIVPPDTLPPFPVSPAVFSARATLVKGGLILCVAVYHAVTDITGFDALLKICAAHCRDGSSQGIGFDSSWIDRSPLFHTSDSSYNSTDLASMPDLLHIRSQEELALRSQASRGAETGQKNYQTAILYFPSQHLRELKDAVTAHIASQEVGSWVSTGDILSSLLWSAILDAENEATLGDKTTQQIVIGDSTRVSTLSFPVQFRSLFRPPLPQDFLGAAFVMTNAKVLHNHICRISHLGAKSQLAQETQTQTGARALASAADIPALAKVALAIRKSTRAIDDATVREVLAYLELHSGTASAKGPLILGPPRLEAGGSGTSVVSWADQSIYELDWGIGIGLCEAVRVPKMEYRRDPIVLPRVPGGMEVIVSYETTLMQKLLDSSIVRRFALVRCLS